MTPERLINIIFALMLLTIITYLYWEDEINDYLDGKKPAILHKRNEVVADKARRLP